MHVFWGSSGANTTAEGTSVTESPSMANGTPRKVEVGSLVSENVEFYYASLYP